MDQMTERIPCAAFSAVEMDPEQRPSSGRQSATEGLTSPSSALRQRRGERGASLVEYALLVGLIALVCIVAIAFFGGSVNSNFTKTGSSVSAAGS